MSDPVFAFWTNVADSQRSRLDHLTSRVWEHAPSSPAASDFRRAGQEQRSNRLWRTARSRRQRRATLDRSPPRMRSNERNQVVDGVSVFPRLPAEEPLRYVRPGSPHSVPSFRRSPQPPMRHQDVRSPSPRRHGLPDGGGVPTASAGWAGGRWVCFPPGSRTIRPHQLTPRGQSPASELDAGAADKETSRAAMRRQMATLLARITGDVEYAPRRPTAHERRVLRDAWPLAPSPAPSAATGEPLASEGEAASGRDAASALVLLTQLAPPLRPTDTLPTSPPQSASPSPSIPSANVPSLLPQPPPSRRAAAPSATAPRPASPIRVPGPSDAAATGALSSPVDPRGWRVRRVFRLRARGGAALDADVDYGGSTGRDGAGPPSRAQRPRSPAAGGWRPASPLSRRAHVRGREAGAEAGADARRLGRHPSGASAEGEAGSVANEIAAFAARLRATRRTRADRKATKAGAASSSPTKAGAASSSPTKAGAASSSPTKAGAVSSSPTKGASYDGGRRAPEQSTDVRMAVLAGAVGRASERLARSWASGLDAVADGRPFAVALV